ncbi:crossover junction endodeoxyribonuclease RuvC [Methylohalomonas lacus]|uniref:Crossover junction endodeoxyribonuclease RuvC n=1 Tax=Methylohalomonas lacus TaxID=398773 RepID=A0AAE3L5W8_9GAMM|nr:crossover junction endodeoxyribonuclease RuvC [Methylohalomonas lacus]MCS3904182.1 crossover junction endodeoxyribonuclease RuvC [Methylohalomonas lacus]
MIRVVGIDPGSRITGFGIIDCEGNHLRHVDHGAIQAGDGELGERLRRIFSELGAAIDRHAPAEAAIERVFMNKNADSAIKLGQARGVAIVAASLQDVAVHEYSANQIKQALVGRGHATKTQIQHMVKILLNLRETPQADAADALAVAVCHAHTRASLQRIPGRTSRAGRVS